MLVKIKQLDGTVKDYTIDDPEKQTIAEFKELISETTGVPSESMKLIFNGRILEDQTKIVETPIKAGDTVTQIMNL